MPYSSTFGPVLGREQVEQAVLTLLQTPPAGSSYPLIVYYLAEVERQRGLQPRTIMLPPGPNSYRGGADFDAFEEEWAPQVTVLAQPEGEAERYDDVGAGTYGQWYEIQLAATVTGQDEDSARRLADRYGAALMLCLLQNGGLGNPSGFTVEKTVLVSAPKTEFPDERIRRLMRSTVILRSFIGGVVQEGGPTSFLPDPYGTPPSWPTVSVSAIKLTGQDPLGNKSTATGVTVTSSTGHVVVNE